MIATQYKSSYVFGEYQKMAAHYNRKVIIYYGHSGHGKGLVDAMSSFGLKGPLLKAVIRQSDNQKLYFDVPVEDIVSLRSDGGKPLKITGCVKDSYHMICFNPNGSILTKINICSCYDCLEGKFMDCSLEKGKLLMGGEADDEDYSSNSDVEFEDDEFGNVDHEMEQYEMRSESVIQVVKPGSVVALFSPPNALELFYLCKILESGIATEDLYDKYEHIIKKGTPYLSVTMRKSQTASLVKMDMVYINCEKIMTWFMCYLLKWCHLKLM